MACGRLKTVVSMKKVSKRKAMSTIGVMSIRMPTRLPFRFFLWRPPPESPPMSTPAMSSWGVRARSPVV